MMVDERYADSVKRHSARSAMPVRTSMLWIAPAVADSGVTQHMLHRWRSETHVHFKSRPSSAEASGISNETFESSESTPTHTGACGKLWDTVQ